MTVFHLCGMALLGLVVWIVLKQTRPDYAAAVGVGTAFLLMFAVFPNLSSLINTAEDLIQKTGFSLYVKVILKAIGIGFLTQITSDICRECGALGIAGKVEFGSKILILSLAVPILEELLSYITEFIK